MATKKQPPPPPPDPLVLGPFDLRDLHDSAMCTMLRDRQNGVRIAAHMALLGHEDFKIRSLVAQLFENQHVLIRRLIELLEQVEDPGVAHAVVMKEKVDDLVRKVEELRDDLNSHDLNNEHRPRRNW